ncbi:MAG: hypothetical protein LBS81_01830 [Endomicrobium sp.]|nr:hypothetical protein [Endomicrobium sp.]
MNVGSAWGRGGDDSGITSSIECLETYQSKIIARLKNDGMSTDELVTDISNEIRKWNIKGMNTEL